MLFEQLKPQSSLPRNHGVIVESMNKGEVILRAEPHRFFVGLIVIRSMEHDFAAVAARCRYLDQRRR